MYLFFTCSMFAFLHRNKAIYFFLSICTCRFIICYFKANVLRNANESNIFSTFLIRLYWFLLWDQSTKLCTFIIAVIVNNKKIHLRSINCWTPGVFMINGYTLINRPTSTIHDRFVQFHFYCQIIIFLMASFSYLLRIRDNIMIKCDTWSCHLTVLEISIKLMNWSVTICRSIALFIPYRINCSFNFLQEAQIECKVNYKYNCNLKKNRYI